jgi:hypothetical protein
MRHSFTAHPFMCVRRACVETASCRKSRVLQVEGLNQRDDAGCVGFPVLYASDAALSRGRVTQLGMSRPLGVAPNDARGDGVINHSFLGCGLVPHAGLVVTGQGPLYKAA